MRFEGVIRRVGEGICSLVFPNRCVGCEAYIDEQRWCCADCAHAVFGIDGPMCRQCGHPRPRVGRGYAGVDEICARCLQRSPRFDRARALWEYSGVIAEALQRAKYRRCPWVLRRLADPLARWLGEQFDEIQRADGSKPLVTVVPMHRTDLRRRGFNAALTLYRLAAPDGVEAEDVIDKVRHTPAQAGLDRHERRDNVRDAFACTRPEQVDGRSVVLFDDVMTTGATADAVARALRRAGATSVTALTAARAVTSQ